MFLLMYLLGSSFPSHRFPDHSFWVWWIWKSLVILSGILSAGSQADFAFSFHMHQYHFFPNGHSCSVLGGSKVSGPVWVAGLQVYRVWHCMVWVGHHLPILKHSLQTGLWCPDLCHFVCQSVPGPQGLYLAQA